MEENNRKTVVVADGNFPVHEVPLGYLYKADVIVCCDGSTENTVNAGFIPDAIVGDMDSLKPDLAKRFSDRIHADINQESNDLTKAVTWCSQNGYNDIVIVGATGKREDHTVGNISLLAEYCGYVNVRMVTDTGIFFPFRRSCKFDTYPGQQVSVFSINPQTEITSAGLRFPLIRKKLKNWWEATLNEAVGDNVEINFIGGPILVFLSF